MHHCHNLGNFFIKLNPHKSKIKGTCTYCGLVVERDAIPSKGYYVCVECKGKKRREYEQKRFERKKLEIKNKKNGNLLG